MFWVRAVRMPRLRFGVWILGPDFGVQDLGLGLLEDDPL